MSHIFGLIGQRKEVHIMPSSQGPQLMKYADLIALIGRIRNTVADVKDPHGILVGAEGFEPTTSLELNQGALTAELHAYMPVHFTSNRRNPSNQPRPEDLSHSKGHLLPQRDGQLELLIHWTELRNLFRPNQLIPVGERFHLHAPR